MKRLSRNEIRAVRAIFSTEHATRSSIARHTRLSLVKVSSILRDLEKKKYIERAGKTKTTGGRPAYIFQLKPSIGVSIGLSITPESFEIVGIDGSKSISIDEKQPLNLPADAEKHVDAIVEQVVPELKRLIAGSPAGQPVVAIGIALPGMVDSRRGVWLLGLQVTGITHIGIAAMFEERLRVPVYVEDASRALTVLEMHKTRGKRIRDFVLVYIGLGLGTGIVINRRIYRGYHGLAGEIGHVEHANNTYRCSCNSVGCLETVVSTAGILRVFRDRLKEGVRSSLQRSTIQDDSGLSLDQILAAADGGDRVAQSTLAEIGVFVGDACATLIKLFNPQRLVISGPGSIFKKYFREPVQQIIQQRVLPEMLQDYQTVFADYRANHEAWGAALLAMKCYLNNLDRRSGKVDT
ncbi:MAG: ROK family protein [Spirochaetaceae bacterium]|nr:MAG: ROK family protein [Spirochaetaceae bacterium]